MIFPIILDVSKCNIPFIDEGVNINGISKESYCMDGDIIIADASEDYNDIGKAIEISNVGVQKVVAGLHTILARDKANVLANKFRGFMMKSKVVHEQIRVLAVGSKVLGISKTNLNKVNVHIPSIPEQHKIADFLTAIDEKIENQKAIIEVFENQKKGFTQKIFSKQLRFKNLNGNTFPDWEEKIITNIAKTSIGLVTTMTENYVENGTKLIRNSDIKPNKIMQAGLINLDVNFAENNKNKEFQKFDIVTVHTGDIGVSAVIGDDMIGSLGFATLNTRPNLDIVNPYYLSLYYNSPKNIKYAITMSTGDGRSNYNLKDFDNAIIPIPSLPEQQKIANFLLSFENKIETEKQNLTHWQTIKKGLLQQLFV